MILELAKEGQGGECKLNPVDLWRSGCLPHVDPSLCSGLFGMVSVYPVWA